MFAPTNDAFNKYLHGSSVDNVGEDDLKDILLNHVLSGKVEKSNLLATETVTAFNKNNIFKT